MDKCEALRTRNLDPSSEYYDAKEIKSELLPLPSFHLERVHIPFCLEFLEASATLFVRSTPSPSIHIMRILRACLIAAPSAVVAVQRSSSHLNSQKMHGKKNARTQSSDASRRRLAAIHCDSVSNGMCYLDTDTTIASESTFTRFTKTG